MTINRSKFRKNWNQLVAIDRLRSKIAKKKNRKKSVKQKNICCVLATNQVIQKKNDSIRLSFNGSESFCPVFTDES